jgi:hypothetical protein
MDLCGDILAVIVLAGGEGVEGHGEERGVSPSSYQRVIPNWKSRKLSNDLRERGASRKVINT